MNGYCLCVCVCAWLSAHDYPNVLTSMCLEAHIASRCHGTSIQVKDRRMCFIRLTNPRQVQPLPQLSTMCWWLVRRVEKLMHRVMVWSSSFILDMGSQAIERATFLTHSQVLSDYDCLWILYLLGVDGVAIYPCQMRAQNLNLQCTKTTKAHSRWFTERRFGCIVYFNLYKIMYMNVILNKLL